MRAERIIIVVAASALAVPAAGCGPSVTSPFDPARAKWDPGLARVIRDEASGVEWGLLQLDRYSSLFGAKDFWLSWRSLDGSPPPALGRLAPGEHYRPPPDFADVSAPPRPISGPADERRRADADAETARSRLLLAGDGRWAPPLFTGVVYLFTPDTSSYVPLEILRFAKKGDSFTLALGLAERARVRFPEFRAIERTFTLSGIAADRDGDALTDVTETLFETDPDSADTDGDGLRDGADRDPLAGVAAATLEQRLIADAFSHYECDFSQPVFFEAPAEGGVTIPNRRCINLTLPAERIAELLARRDPAHLDRSVEVIRHEFDMHPDKSRAAVKLIDTLGWRRFFYRVDGTERWSAWKTEGPRLHDERTLSE